MYSVENPVTTVSPEARGYMNKFVSKAPTHGLPKHSPCCPTYPGRTSSGMICWTCNCLKTINWVRCDRFCFRLGWNSRIRNFFNSKIQIYVHHLIIELVKSSTSCLPLCVQLYDPSVSQIKEIFELVNIFFSILFRADRLGFKSNSDFQHFISRPTFHHFNSYFWVYSIIYSISPPHKPKVEGKVQNKVKILVTLKQIISK